MINGKNMTVTTNCMGMNNVKREPNGPANPIPAKKKPPTKLIVLGLAAIGLIAWLAYSKQATS